MEHITLHGTHANGRTALVNDEDADWLNSYRWYAKRGYAVARLKCGKMVFMHRMILGLTNSTLYVDHINGDKLNNQRHNIRTCTIAQNNCNRKTAAHKKYLGVRQHRTRNCWKARISTNGKRYTVECRTEEEAALEYNRLAIKYHGEFARLNVVAPN